MCVDDNGDHRVTFILSKSMATTIVTEVFPEPLWHQSTVEGERQDPFSKLRLSSEYCSLEICFSTLEAALDVASAIQDMVGDALDAVKSHSLTPRVKVRVITPPTEQPYGQIPF